MKLSLDELKVDSYAIQASETELAEVKGGTTITCFIAAAAAWTAVVTYLYPNTGVGGLSGGSSSGGGTTFYGIEADSVNIDGVIYYNFKADSLTN